MFSTVNCKYLFVFAVCCFLPMPCHVPCFLFSCSHVLYSLLCFFLSFSMRDRLTPSEDEPAEQGVHHDSHEERGS